MSAIVSLRDLTVTYRTEGTPVVAVQGVDLDLAPGETVAIVGESGSGKSTIAAAIIGLLADNARITSGTVEIGGVDVTTWNEARRRTLRGRKIGYVPQDPLVGLNPTLRVGRQIAEAIVQARGHRPRSIDADVVELLEQVGIDQPTLRARQYPHQLSGGLRQRVLIAIALAGGPELIIADEPTSALDVTVQRRILDHLERLAGERGIALLLITHDLGVAAERAHRVIVTRAGRIVDEGSAHDILVAPASEYTRTLIEAVPAFGGGGAVTRTTDAPVLLSVDRVVKEFDLPRVRGGERTFRAVDEVSFEVRRGETLGIVGESGSGKTTLLRIALGVESASSGSIRYEGVDTTARRRTAVRELRRRVQLVQQNPYASLDPRFTVFESIIEPLVSLAPGGRREREDRARELVDLVQLPQSFLNRRPRERPGGQRQRVAIARALALHPELIFLDEPVSALDVSVQAQILALLRELQRELDVAYVLVSHDLAVVSSIAHRVLVLQRGVVQETGDTAQVFSQPASPYTRELIEAIPGRGLAVSAL